MDYSNYESEDQYNRRKEHYKQSIKDCKHERLINSMFPGNLICTKCMKMFDIPLVGLN